MGHASSKEVRHEPQTTRRLSKPPTNLSSLNVAQTKAGKSPRSPNHDQSPPLDESMFWKSPWTGDLLPKSNPETDLTDRNRVRSFTSFSSLQPESRGSLQGSKRWSSIDDFVLMKQDSSLSRSSSFLSRRLSRRSSMIHRPSFQSQSEGVTVGETRREPVIHFGPSDIGSHDLHSSVETLTSEDRSPVEDSYVLMGRRKSFRRPGVATRTPSWGLYRTPLSSIQQEDEKPPIPEILTAQLSHEWEEDDDFMPLSRYHERATSPVALDYSHLSGFKKGTLRIVNASVSPASTDRIRLLTTSPSHKKLPKSVLSQGDSAVFISNSAHQDEAVVIPENGFCFEDLDVAGDGQYLETPGVIASDAIGFTRMQKIHSNTNADSGYSSVSSIHSSNSSAQSGSSPASSPVSSPARYKVGSPADNCSYFADGLSKPNEVMLQNLVPSGSSSSGSQQIPCTGSEQTRYYAQLSLLNIPSVPEAAGIYDKESDSEGDMDDEQIQSPFSPILPKHAFAQVAKEQIEETVQRAISTHKPPVDKAQTYEAPRGRARSRSAGRGRTKLVKTRRVAV
ncbi:uncharacterized protein BHQ10_006322 [Talaromyces amestolkiae]|uniref:Uncharacterized protein n=1 Tax=Talaromyces amestolkiae TaxID=1196081 RepID=A0A364L3C6_TALAM|nr:uncharacterized protein BHQ10_006322 [Talaromyces amestolkiae]RAO70310.1 hypothetical protein BHQ10_006322 [Talaromyces amestolkiae]